MTQPYKPTWRSLRSHRTPQWLRDAKFGIYTHWGVYAVPACGPNATWYPYNMYRPGTPQYEHHVKTYGGPSAFGYKDFIPQFTGEHFDPDAWASLFKAAGARFAGPVGEHHDGFAMWESRITEWNAARMGPKRDVVGELRRAIRAKGMRFLVALHHAENWWFFPHWEPDYDTADPAYAGLYGSPHNLETPPGEEFFDQEPPDEAFLDRWLGKTIEIIDGYQPDMLWFDFGLRRVQEHYKRRMLAAYYNRARQWNRDVAVTYKWHDLAPGSGVVDLELGRMGELTYHEWITDTSVDDQGAWGYVRDAGYKPVSALIHNLVDNVSKNGYLLLNVGPRADGTIPQPAQDRLLELGAWLEINGEAIYGTAPWMTYGEGPTKMEKTGYFSEEQEVSYTPKDIRYTTKDDVLYAFCLGEPTEPVTLTALKTLYPEEIQAVTMVGTETRLNWSLDPKGLTITPPADLPCRHACAFKIIRKEPFTT